MASKGRRIATASGFVSGVIASLDALKDAPETWPPDALWRVLNRPHRFELCGGIALILVTFVVSLKRKDYE